MLSVADQITAEAHDEFWDDVEELRTLMNPTKEDLAAVSNKHPAEHSSAVALSDTPRTDDALARWGRSNVFEGFVRGLERENAELRKRCAWVPVEERLPEENFTDCLVNLDCNEAEVTVFIDGWPLPEAHEDCKVTHWMPLPQPPVPGDPQDSIESK